MGWKVVGGVVGEDGVSEVAEFWRNCLKPSFFVTGESSDSRVGGSSCGGGPNIGGVSAVFQGVVDLSSDAKASDMFFKGLVSAVFFRIEGGDE
jgi:hypothetical protein